MAICTIYSIISLTSRYLFNGIFLSFFIQDFLNWIIDSNPLSFSSQVVFIKPCLYNAFPTDFIPNLKIP